MKSTCALSMERLHTHAALCLCALFLVLGASPAHALPRWTILVYLDGDNNLEPDGINDVNEMETVGSDSNVNIVVQFDRISGYDSSNGNWTDCRRAKIIKDGNTGTMGSFDLSLPTCAGIGEVNMGDPATLSNFVAWGMAAYPAEQYMLVLWNHGGGWELAQAALAAAGGKTGHFKAVCWDDSSGGDCLYTREVRSALEHLPTLSVIGFDACLMAMIEVAYEMRGRAGVFVASEDLEPGDGWPYDLFLADLKANPLMTPAQLGACIVARYGKYYATRGEAVTQSCLDLTKLPALSSAVDAFAVAALDAPPAWNSIIAARATASWYSDKAFRDLEGIAGQLSSSSLSNEARAVSAAFHQALITNYSAAVLEGRGLTVYFPNGAVDGDYAAAHIQFARDTQWDEFIRALQPTPPANDGFNSAYALLAAYGSTAGNNEAATAEPDEPRIAGVTARHSLWWSFTPPWPAPEFEIDTQGSDFDTVLGVFTGATVSTLKQIVANDDERSGLLTSRAVVTNPAAGITYQIAVDGYGGDTGSIALNWNLVPEPACAVAVVLLTVRRRARR